MNLQAGDKLIVDSAPVIYLIEGQGKRAEKVAAILDLATEAGATWVTSLITYMELLVQPARKGHDRLAAKYRDLLTNSEQMALHPLDITVADEAVRLRARHGIKLPDAVQLATALVCGADAILTNNRAWQGLVPIPVVCVDD